MSSSEQRRLSLLDRIYDINEKDFDTVASDVRQYQYDHNPLFQKYCNLLGVSDLTGMALANGPFLPITLFRDHPVQAGIWNEETIFRSSGTTGSVQSRHLVRDLNGYHQNATAIFSKFFGHPEEYTWIALLPSYLERQDSSLVSMIHHFMQFSQNNINGFYTSIDNQLLDQLNRLKDANKKTIMFGVTFALLQLFEMSSIPSWEKLIVIETGGMKGRGPELTRMELHDRLKSNHHDLYISSEYGMTELMSQAYLMDGKFHPGNTLRAYTRDISDPMTSLRPGQRGALNFIDLANIDTCSFVATEDLGIVYDDGCFEVLGRLDQSDLRGCNLLYT